MIDRFWFAFYLDFILFCYGVCLWILSEEIDKEKRYNEYVKYIKQKTI